MAMPPRRVSGKEWTDMSGSVGDWAVVGLLFGVTVFWLAYVFYRGKRDSEKKEGPEVERSGNGQAGTAG